MLKRIAAGGVAAVVGLGVWGVAGEDHTTRDEAGTIVAGGQLGAFATQVGDCFESLPSSVEGVSTIPAVPCSNQHHWQVYHKGSLNATEFNESSIYNESDLVCMNFLESYIPSMPVEKYEIFKDAEFSTLIPTSASWEKGDRSVDCLIGSDIINYYESFI